MHPDAASRANLAILKIIYLKEEKQVSNQTIAKKAGEDLKHAALSGVSTGLIQNLVTGAAGATALQGKAKETGWMEVFHAALDQFLTEGEIESLKLLNKEISPGSEEVDFLIDIRDCIKALDPICKAACEYPESPVIVAARKAGVDAIKAVLEQAALTYLEKYTNVKKKEFGNREAPNSDFPA